MKKPRARILAEYLEDVLDWTIYDRNKSCPDCGRRVFKVNDENVYCGRCGGLLELAIDGQEDTEYELEIAIQQLELIEE